MNLRAEKEVRECRVSAMKDLPGYYEGLALHQSLTSVPQQISFQSSRGGLSICARKHRPHNGDLHTGLTTSRCGLVLRPREAFAVDALDHAYPVFTHDR